MSPIPESQNWPRRPTSRAFTLIELLWAMSVLFSLVSFALAWGELHIPGGPIPGFVAGVIGVVGVFMMHEHIDRARKPIHSLIYSYLLLGWLVSLVIGLAWSRLVGACIVAPMVASGVVWLIARLALTTYRKLSPNSATP